MYVRNTNIESSIGAREEMNGNGNVRRSLPVSSTGKQLWKKLIIYRPKEETRSNRPTESQLATSEIVKRIMAQKAVGDTPSHMQRSSEDGSTTPCHPLGLSKTSSGRSASRMSGRTFERSVVRTVRKKKLVGFRKHVILLLDDPRSSWAATVLHILIPAVIMLSVAIAIILSLDISEDSRKLISLVQTICDASFMLELILRIVVQCDDLLSLADTLFFLDTVSGVCPILMDIIYNTNITFTGNSPDHLYDDLPSRFRRFFVLIRILKLIRHYDGALALAKAMRRSASPLLAPLFFSAAGILLFAGLMCVIEHETSTNGDFDNIPRAIWFSVVTLTTIGYGDVVPSSAGGKSATALCGIFAVLFMAMPLTIVGNNFAECWNEREASNVILRLQEFIMLNELDASDIMAIFEVFDHDKSGFIDMAEFKAVLEFLGLHVAPHKVIRIEGISKLTASQLRPPVAIGRSSIRLLCESLTHSCAPSDRRSATSFACLIRMARIR